MIVDQPLAEYDANGKLVALLHRDRFDASQTKIDMQAFASMVSGAWTRGPRSRILRNCLSAQVSGASTGYDGYVTHWERELAGKPILVRFWVPNITTLTPTLTLRFGFASSLAALNSAASAGGGVTFTGATFGGAASVAQPVRLTDVTANLGSRPSWTTTDWMPARAPARVDGRKGSVIHIQIRQLTGISSDPQTWQVNTLAATAATEAVMSQMSRGYRSTGSAALGSATINATAVGGVIPVIVEYVTLELGVSLIVVGNSIDMGTKAAGIAAYGGMSYANYAQALMTSDTCPVEVCNLGWGGQTAVEYTRRYLDMALPGGVLVYGAGDVNSLSQPITSGNIDTLAGQLGLAMQAAAANDHVMILRNANPANAKIADGGSGNGAGADGSAKSFGSGDPLRTAWNSQLAAAFGRQVFDCASVWSGNPVASGAAAGQIEYAAQYVDDGLHPNGVGYPAAGVRFSSDFSWLTA